MLFCFAMSGCKPLPLLRRAAGVGASGFRGHITMHRVFLRFCELGFTVSGFGLRGFRVLASGSFNLIHVLLATSVTPSSLKVAEDCHDCYSRPAISQGFGLGG